MSELTKYEAYKKKLEGICDENDLQYRLRYDPDRPRVEITIYPSDEKDPQIALDLD